MEQSFMIIFSALLTFFYVVLIVAYFISWEKIPYFTTNPSAIQLGYTIMVPARNEEYTIQKCLNDILAQQYTSSLFEIIVINDHSTDNTAKVVQSLIDSNPEHRIVLLNMEDDLEKRHLKKAAITYGISTARYDFIILTDADCERKPNWLTAINSFMQKSGSKMIYAPVLFKANTLFEKIQSLEFAGLVAIGGAAIELKNPNMCSASNLILNKKTFYEVGGYHGNENVATGDDEFLLHKFFKAYPDDVHFLKSRDAIVTTSANTSLRELTDQRRRWVSKSAKYENRYITAILVAAYLFNAGIVYHLIFNFQFGLSILIIKALTEGIFLFSVLKFFKRKQYILFLPLAEPFHILYVLIIGIWANIGTYNWKGRQVR
jgi:cellulose synthase/poly-beta-1,6-N-acetylglucosamine synthase-like glycosyltransferase